MIVAEAAERGLRLVTQPDHAHLAAEILRLWRADGLPEHPRRKELLFAVREHDNGWREVDGAPRVNPGNGAPMDFLEVPEALRREIWERGIRRYLTRRPYAAALIAEHALHLFAGVVRSEAREEFLEKIKKAQDDGLELSGLPRAALTSDYAWLQLADDVSLWICTGRAQLERPDRRGRRTADAWELDPFPFAGATTFRLPCRHVPRGPYPSDAAYAGAAATARWDELPVRVRPVSAGALPW